GKELDEETGLYYYGARYYNPRESVWLSTDPLSGYNPVMETEHYIDGQHNEGVYNSFNLNTYGYCYQSPIILIDPNGKQVWTRILGGVKAVGGALEMVAGGALLVTPEPTMATKAAGVVVAVHGADVASSGLRQMWTGEEESSLTSQGLQAAGMSKQNAEIVDASISIIGSGGAGLISNTSKAGNISGAVSNYSKIGSTGKVGEDALKLLGGESQVPFKTSKGMRYIDQLVGNSAHESKVGYTTLSKGVQKQIMKDADLIQKGQIESSTWHFFKSPVTGKGGHHNL
ncbi:RHS repeat-associated core domain-containing protein, partial [Apibacter sp. B3546]